MPLIKRTIFLQEVPIWATEDDVSLPWNDFLAKATAAYESLSPERRAEAFVKLRACGEYADAYLEIEVRHTETEQEAQARLDADQILVSERAKAQEAGERVLLAQLKTKYEAAS